MYIKTIIGVLRTSRHSLIPSNKFKDFVGIEIYPLIRRTPIRVYSTIYKLQF